MPLVAIEGEGVVYVAAEAERLLPPDSRGIPRHALAALAGLAIDDPRLSGLLETTSPCWVGVPRGRLCVLPGPRGITAVLMPDALRARSVEQRGAGAEMAAAAAHEMANALAAISGWAELARRDPEQRDRALDLIERASSSARHMARGLMATARPEIGVDERLDLAATLDDVVQLLAPQARRHGVTVVVESTPSPVVVGRDADLRSLLWNLAKNAVEAARSRVEIAVDGDDDFVTVEVRDDGPGLPAGVAAEQLFTAWFTTKADGTGLGLSIARAAAERLGGALCAQSDARGARMSVALPRAVHPGVDRRVPAHSGVRQRPHVGLRVLVVDDDEAVRELIVTTLALNGAAVVAAASAAEARASTGTFDVALVDMTLADARGDALLGDLMRAGKVRRAVLVSGAEPPDDLDPATARAPWLRKPFELDELLESLLGRADAAATAG